ncbi:MULTISPECIES: AraC family transcriptional regulator [Xanthobacteraceae]|uniref:AraC family transcriptional regulator n=1 Tax=Labrys monachus TaxID=217067 RepID=A0ABU0FFW9_9HYPH|nr:MULTISPECIES: AraC family transcriptional regulator [Xanthobacteraceae]MBS7538200.1 helix-turn-helix transcriptional regulator [Ancylobacter lacus]MDQ0393508.1 AraC family transcriptional regulator [Labrys monachus]
MAVSKWLSYADFYRESSYQAFPQEHRRAQGLLAYNLIQVEQGPHNFVDPEVPETILALPLTVDRRCTWRWTMGGKSSRESAEPGRLLAVPSGVESRWEIDGSRKILLLTVPDSTVRSVLGSSCPKRVSDVFWTLSRDTWVDPFVEVLLNRMWQCGAGGEAADRYLADGLLVSMLSQLLIRAGARLDDGAPVALPQWRLRRVREFVEANLDQDIGLDELADAAGFSRRHFARSFRTETGETPHRWLMKVRLERALLLLRETEETLVDISDQCGFSSQSHFTTTMKLVTGMTPRQWRQNNQD